MKPVKFPIRKTFTLDIDSIHRLDFICEFTDNSQSYVIRRGIQFYYDWLNDWINSADGQKAIGYLSGAGAAPQIGGKAQDEP